MGFFALRQSHTTALRVNLGVHSHGPTSHGVCSRVSRPAAFSSITTSMSGWAWRCEAGTWSVIWPSTTRCTMRAFSSPQAMSTMRSARRMVSMPIVMAILGVLSSPKKASDCILRVL